MALRHRFVPEAGFGVALRQLSRQGSIVGKNGVQNRGFLGRLPPPQRDWDRYRMAALG